MRVAAEPRGLRTFRVGAGGGPWRLQCGSAARQAQCGNSRWTPGSGRAASEPTQNQGSDLAWRRGRGRESGSLTSPGCRQQKYCTLQLAHLGANVIRNQSSTRPCVTRLLPPWPGANRAASIAPAITTRCKTGANGRWRSISAGPGALEIARRLNHLKRRSGRRLRPGGVESAGIGLRTSQSPSSRTSSSYLSSPAIARVGPCGDFRRVDRRRCRFQGCRR